MDTLYNLDLFRALTAKNAKVVDFTKLNSSGIHLLAGLPLYKKTSEIELFEYFFSGLAQIQPDAFYYRNSLMSHVTVHSLIRTDCSRVLDRSDAIAKAKKFLVKRMFPSFYLTPLEIMPNGIILWVASNETISEIRAGIKKSYPASHHPNIIHSAYMKNLPGTHWSTNQLSRFASLIKEMNECLNGNTCSERGILIDDMKIVEETVHNKNNNLKLLHERNKIEIIETIRLNLS